MTEYMIQGCYLSGEIAYTVFVKTKSEMLQEVTDGLNKGFIMQIGKVEK